MIRAVAVSELRGKDGEMILPPTACAMLVRAGLVVVKVVWGMHLLDQESTVVIEVGNNEASAQLAAFVKRRGYPFVKGRFAYCDADKSREGRLKVFVDHVNKCVW